MCHVISVNYISLTSWKRSLTKGSEVTSRRHRTAAVSAMIPRALEDGSTRKTPTQARANTESRSSHANG